MDQQISKTAVSSPSSSPGLYSPSPPTQRQFSSNSEGTPVHSPYLHPLQMHKVRETHKAAIEQDFITGRKLINQYEILDEIGRGVHGKVKLARNLETNEYVAIKIIQRFSKKRRLGKVTVSPEAKIKREIAILKKIRHPNVVGLLEVIDDPELKKIYIILEHVELGEVVWRKKGTPLVCAFERRRIERELRGESDAGEDEKYFKLLERRRQRKEAQRAKFQGSQALQPGDFWSLEHGDDEDDFDLPALSRTSTHESAFQPRSYTSHTSHTSMVRSNPGSASGSRATSRTPSQVPSRTNSRASFVTNTPVPNDIDQQPIESDHENEDEAVGPLPSIPSTHSSGVGLHSSISNQQIHHAGSDEASFRGRSPSMADSVVSHMSSVDDVTQHDQFEEDFSYVPCFTMEQARSTFRDTVLGLEYLHYEGIVHRDIKPANLLWTREHRVKISDFGVSYFGRPIRDGEPDDAISETDAQDFDDDLELAKTVGTPAFFAPELCYTDLDVEQPKVTEQIDVWSLGVTLYCLIYARIPFLADDEYQLFRAIATQDAYIPRKRLKPVNPFPPVAGEIPPPEGLYREEGELVMEEVDDELYDLLRRMLLKDPTERMKLREVKRHPWVLRGIDNVIGWLDDTDPSRRTSGRRIQVDDRELEHAVVPITFLERARSTIKKTINKAFGRSDTSRKRAVSNATSGGSEAGQRSPSVTHRDARRASLRGDESYFAIAEELRDLKEHPVSVHHPLSQSVTASPEHPSPSDSFDQLAGVSVSMPVTPRPGLESAFGRPPPPDRNIPTTSSIQTVIHRGHMHSRSLASTIPTEGADGAEDPVDLFATFTDHRGGVIRDTMRTLNTARSMDLKEATTSGSTTRSQSSDRAFFKAADKHAEPVTGVSMAVAPGNVAVPTPHKRLETRSMDSSPTHSEQHLNHLHGQHPHHTISAHHFFRPSILASHQQSMSSPNVPVIAAEVLENRPATATRLPEARTPAPRPPPSSTEESFARAQEQLNRRHRLELEAEEEDKKIAAKVQPTDTITDPAAIECPPSPDDEIFHQKQEEEAKRAKSTSSMNSISLMSPITSPSDVTSPISSTTLGSSNLGGSQDQLFPSDPSLPTLLSGASSVSADPEGDFLMHPGTVHSLSSDSPETLTPPSLSKLPSHEATTPTPSNTLLETIIPSVNDNIGDYHPYGDLSIVPTDDDDDDSDSDEGLTMSKSKNRAQSSNSSPPKRSFERRGTTASVESTDTAKKVSMT